MFLDGGMACSTNAYNKHATTAYIAQRPESPIGAESPERCINVMEYARLKAHQHDETEEMPASTGVLHGISSIITIQLRGPTPA